MSQDDLDHIPSIVPTRDSDQQYAKPRSRSQPAGAKGKGGGNGRGKPPPSSGGGAGIWARLFITVALVVAAVACAWAWQLQEQLQQSTHELARATERITDLEDRLSDTDEGLSQNTQAMAVKIKELYSEVDKLWASAWRRNKARLDDLEGASKSQGQKVAAHDKSIAQAQSQLKAASADLAKLRGVAGDMERLMSSAKANGAEVERVADNLNKINLDLAKMNKRIQSNEEWVNSINAFRRQINSDLSALQTQLRNMQTPGAVP